MKKLKHLVVAVLAVVACGLFSRQSSAQDGTKKLGWQLGTQAWTFNRYTFSEALDKTAACGLKFIEAFPTQKIGGGVEGTMDFHMDKATIKAVKKMAKKHGIKIVSYGVVVPKNHEDWEQLFKFAKAMDLENIVSEPDEKDIPFLSELCDRYKINLAIHDHPKPSHYWNPDILLKVIEGASPRIGSCADIGHWTRSGLDPLECLKKVAGHVKELHFKDLNEQSPDAHDVVWGTGVNKIKEIMAELKRQDFRGPVMAEYEYNWENNVPDVQASAAFFHQEANKLAE